MAWYRKVIPGWVIFNVTFVLATWLRSVIIVRADRRASGGWGVKHLPERLVRQLLQRAWPTFAAQR
jgi:hypothetical protein